MEGPAQGTSGSHSILRRSSRSAVLNIGKLFGAKLVYIEIFDRIDKPTMTGRMVYPITDAFIVQWEEQTKVYPKAVNLGSVF